MQITVRSASEEDLSVLVRMYRDLEAEQTVKKPVWALTDGLDEPIIDSLRKALAEDESWLSVGEIDGVPVGLVWATIDTMLSRADGERIGRIRLIYTEPDARGVGVGDAMLEQTLTLLRSLGLKRFDAPVGPGQRLTKNFFEGHGFAARSLIMHHHDVDEGPTDDA